MVHDNPLESWLGKIIDTNTYVYMIEIHIRKDRRYYIIVKKRDGLGVYIYM